MCVTESHYLNIANIPYIIRRLSWWFSFPFLSLPSLSLLTLTAGVEMSSCVYKFDRTCVCVLVAQLCPTLCDPTDCSPPGFSVHGILQARILEWIAIPFSRGTSQPRNRTLVSCMAGRFFTVWATAMVNNFTLELREKSSTHWISLLKKVGETTRPFRYDLNQIPYDYTAEEK